MFCPNKTNLYLPGELQSHQYNDGGGKATPSFNWLGLSLDWEDFLVE